MSVERKKRLPVCIAQYEAGHAQCDNASPCFWRDRCVAFQTILNSGRRTRPREFFVKTVTIADEKYSVTKAAFDHDRLCEKLDLFVMRHKIIDGRITHDRGQEPVTQKKAGPERKTNKGREAMAWFHKQLGSALEMEYARNLGSAVAGELYFSDKMLKSGYVSTYAVCKGKRKVPLTQVRMNLHAISVKFSLTRQQFRELLPKPLFQKLNPEVIKSGRFVSLVRRVDKGDASVLAQAVATAAGREMIDLA